MQGCAQPCMIWSALQMSRTREWGGVARLAHESWGTLLCCTILRCVLIPKSVAPFAPEDCHSHVLWGLPSSCARHACHKLCHGGLPDQANPSCCPGWSSRTQDACVGSLSWVAPQLSPWLACCTEVLRAAALQGSLRCGLDSLLAYRDPTSEGLALDEQSQALVSG